jgi:hypothetical protein
MDDFGMTGLSSLAELNYMRLEAMDLFDHCLTEGKPDRLVEFIEQQISQDPPRIELLRDVADDFNQRVIGLHENYLDVWYGTLDTLKAEYGFPVDQEFASRPFGDVDVEEMMGRLREHQVDPGNHNEMVLRQMLNSALETATQLRADIAMTERLYVYLSDWIDGLNATVARRYWAEGRNDDYAAGVH